MQSDQATLQLPIVHAARRWLRERVAGVFARFAAEIRARRTQGELEALSDHILRDLGLRRDQIELVSRKPRG